MGQTETKRIEFKEASSVDVHKDTSPAGMCVCVLCMRVKCSSGLENILIKVHILYVTNIFWTWNVLFISLQFWTLFLLCMCLPHSYVSYARYLLCLCSPHFLLLLPNRYHSLSLFLPFVLFPPFHYFILSIPIIASYYNNNSSYTQQMCALYTKSYCAKKQNNNEKKNRLNKSIFRWYKNLLIPCTWGQADHILSWLINTSLANLKIHETKYNANMFRCLWLWLATCFSLERRNRVCDSYKFRSL